MPRSILPTAVLLTLAIPSIAAAQASDFTNFEILPEQSLAIARVGDRDYLAVCNTPADALEVFDTVDHRRVARIPVGARPVSVVWNPGLERFATCDRLGDSVTEVRFEDPGDGSTPTAVRDRTAWVGDAPTHLAWLPDQLSFFVTFADDSAVGWYLAKVLLPVAARIDWTVPLLDPNATRALAEPRRAAWLGTTLVVLNGKGGGDPTRYDLDLAGLDFATFAQPTLGGLGTAAFDCAASRDGRLFVVGQRARAEVAGEAALAALETGFVESRLWVVDDLGGAAPRVTSRDLHRDAAGAVVARDAAVAQPTAVALVEDAATLRSVWVAGFGSDRLAVLNPDSGEVANWSASRVALPTPRLGYARVGPRALAVKEAAPATGDPGRLVYVHGAVDQSVTAYDADTRQVVARFGLEHDPTPDVVRRGREFLYSADLSGNGFTSCASCHIDGHHDRLRWDLGEPAGGLLGPVPPDLPDAIVGTPQPGFFGRDKGPMTTQSLRGLAEARFAGEGSERVSGAPFHWRGDRPTIDAFSRTFVELMGAPDLAGGSEPRGIPADDMATLRRFLETIVLPPNPEQPLDRQYSGEFGTPSQRDGHGAKRGLEVFLGHPLPGGQTGGRSCVHCHTLPAGSNHRLTVGSGLDFFESAPLRDSRSREPVLERSPIELSTVRISENGLTHLGRGSTSGGTNSLSINGFAAGFAPFFPPVMAEFEQLLDLIRLLREFDTGTAPLVGRAFTVDRDGVATAETTAAFDRFEGQAAAANVEVAVHASIGPARLGLWLDVTAEPARYRNVEGTVGYTRAELLDRLTAAADRLFVHATPLGAARRIAAGSMPPPLLGAPPRRVRLEPMRPTTAWRGVPRVTRNWVPGSDPDEFRWDGDRGPSPVDEPQSLRTLRIFQRALIAKAPDFGLDALRHEAPRRVRLSGEGIRHGAALELGVPAEPGVAPPYTGGERIETWTLPIFPTGERDARGLTIWETEAEIPPQLVHELLLGGPFAPDVRAAAAGLVDEPPPPTAFDPRGWNRYRVIVRNADGTARDAGWQRLTITSP